MAAANVVTGRFHEDYPESYKNAEGDELCVETEEDLQAKAASSLVAIFEKRVALRSARCKHPRDLKHVSVAQLDFEYDYVVNRFFGEKIGADLYDEDHEEFDDLYKDSVDEISILWLETYKERYDREPPVHYVEYAFPLKGVSVAKQTHWRETLDAAYARLRALALDRESATNDATRGNFLSCPKGISKKRTAAAAADARAAAAAAAPPPPADSDPVIVPIDD